MQQFISTLSLFLLAISAMADSGYTVRKNCLGFLNWKYKSWAQVWPKYYSSSLTSWGSSNFTSCSPNSSLGVGFDAAFPGGPAVKAYANAASSGGQSYVFFSGPGYSNKFSAGLTANMLEG